MSEGGMSEGAMIEGAMSERAIKGESRSRAELASSSSSEVVAPHLAVNVH